MGHKSFEEIVALWQADKKQYVKRSTYSAYSLLINNHLLPSFSGISDVTETLVQDFVFKKLEQGMSQKSVRDILIVLRMILRYGVKHGYMAHREIDVKFPTEREKNEIEVLSRNNQRQIMNYVQSHFNFMNLGIYICLCAGLRIGEVCALVWDDIDIEAGVIKISKTIQRIYVIEGNEKHTEVIIDTPKSRNSIREIPIAKDLLRMIKPFKKVVNGGYYVLTNSDHPTEPRSYRTYYKRLMKLLDMPDLKFHGLRHSFATRCIESKCDYKTVSVLLGHSSISTTLNLYVHPNMEQKKKCVEQMFKTLR
ncbi:MAG: site-specific integrase [Bacteroidales bacterium]|nr:site-specific integrase [Bacteroidales bacterium]